MSYAPYEHILDIMRDTPPSMKYTGEEPFEVWQTRVLIKLNELLGLPFKKCDDDLKIEYEKKHETFTEIRFTFQSEQNYYVPCHFLIPPRAEKPLPVVICLQGHTTGMHLSLGRTKYPGDEELLGGDRDFAIRAVCEGYCALTIEQRCFGECGGTVTGIGEQDCYMSSMAALLIGRTTIGERVWDVQRAIDVLEKHFPQADMRKIICMGNSGGGTTTFYAACTEPRISFIMPSCAFCAYYDSIAVLYCCSCNFIPGIRNYFDMGDLAGLIAPRPLVIVAAMVDEYFPLDGVKKAFATAKSQYAAVNAMNNLVLVVGNNGHRFYADDAWRIMNLFIYR